MTDQEIIDSLPVFRMVINPENEAFVHAVALTNDPAHSSMYLAFNNDPAELVFSSDESKNEVLGAAIIPNKKILRKPNNVFNGYHNIVFEADDIRLMSKEFFKQGFHHNININHTDKTVEGYFFQSIIIGDEVGQGRVNGLDLPNGSWVLGCQIEDAETFEAVKKWGYSVEGLFNYMGYDSAQVADIQSIQLSDEQLLAIELIKLTEYMNKVKHNQYNKKQ